MGEGQERCVPYARPTDTDGGAGKAGEAVQEVKGEERETSVILPITKIHF